MLMLLLKVPAELVAMLPPPLAVHACGCPIKVVSAVGLQNAKLLMLLPGLG
jgi:hypothetical protein